MTDREKLIEWMTAIPPCPDGHGPYTCKGCRYVDEKGACDEIAMVADIMIANGVVVREWVPVTERLPEQYEGVIVWTMWGEMGEAEHDGKRFRWAYDNDVAAATHWMPLPEPPADMRKGENDGTAL